MIFHLTGKEADLRFVRALLKVLVLQPIDVIFFGRNDEISSYW